MIMIVGSILYIYIYDCIFIQGIYHCYKISNNIYICIIIHLYYIYYIYIYNIQHIIQHIYINTRTHRQEILKRKELELIKIENNFENRIENLKLDLTSAKDTIEEQKMSLSDLKTEKAELNEQLSAQALSMDAQAQNENMLCAKLSDAEVRLFRLTHPLYNNC